MAIDGKTSRRARTGDDPPLHLVSAWASRQRLVLGQEAMSGKDNEITAIPCLLDRLELTGALVTIDAIGCQRAIATTIRARGANYLLALKANWPALAGEVRLFFDQEADSAFDRVETCDGDHGRIDVRRHWVSHDVAWLSTNRRFPGEPRFPDLAMIARIETDVDRNGKTCRANRYHLGSALLSARQFARAARAHWGIENRLHWDMMAFRGLLEKNGDADLLREMIGFAAERLMELEVGAHTGAALGEKSPTRLAQRNGYRDQTWETRAGTIERRIPRLRTGSYFPSFLEPRRMAEKALTAMVQEA